jgi:prepilin-type N-terminal cleavage/methylation domain-containing protein
MRMIKYFFKKRRQSAFTLVEMLLAVSILAAVTVSLYQALSHGLRVWERSRQLSVEEDVMIFFDKLATDLRNSFDFSLFDFEGGSGRIVFSTVISVPMGKGAEETVFFADQIGRVEYGLDSMSNAIYRRQANYGQAIKGGFGAVKILARPVKSITFQYFKRGQNALSLQKLDRKKLPDAVEVSVEYKDSRGNLQVMTRLINLPIFL